MKSVALLQGKFHQMFDRFSNIMFNAQNILSHSKMLSLLYTILETKKRQIILKEKSKAVH